MFEIMLTYFLILIIIVILVYYFLTWNYSHWTRRGINGPKPMFLFGNFPLTLWYKRKFTEDYTRIYEEYKEKDRICGIYFARDPFILVLDPLLARDVLVKHFKHFHDNESHKWTLDPITEQNPFFLTGEKWKVKRAEIVPALTTAKLKLLYPVMQTTSKRITKYIEEKAIKQKVTDGIDAKELCNMFTIDNMTNCLYGVEAGAFEGYCPIKENIGDMVKLILQMISYHMTVTMFPPLKWFKKMPSMPIQMQNFFCKLMDDALALRKNTKTNRYDILTYLMETQEKKDLTNLNMVGHAMTFFVDGTETSSVVMANCLNMLARHEDIQNKLRDEINEAITAHGELSFEQIQDLPYMDQVISETIRLYPPGPVLSRVCTEAIEIENYKDKIVKIEKGDTLTIPIHCYHYDERFFDNPYDFNPDRFSPDHGGLKKFRDMGTFLPFGDGPRACLGMKLAQIQMKTGLAEVVKNWEIRLNPKTRDDIEVDAEAFLLLPLGGIWLDFKRID